MRSAERLVYVENQFLWSPEIVHLLVDKLRDPPSDDFRVVALLPARPNDGADVSKRGDRGPRRRGRRRRAVPRVHVYARTGPLRDLVYVHAKIGIVDDRWFTIGSANLNERSLFNDSEVNVVTLDPGLARRRGSGSGSEHLEATEPSSRATRRRSSTSCWRPTAKAQLENLENGRPLTHRLVMLPGVSRRARRLSGALKSRVYDG